MAYPLSKKSEMPLDKKVFIENIFHYIEFHSIRLNFIILRDQIFSFSCTYLLHLLVNQIQNNLFMTI